MIRRFRYWLITILVGEDTVIMNAVVKRGSIRMTLGKNVYTHRIKVYDK